MKSVHITTVGCPELSEWDQYVQRTDAPYPYMLSNFRRIIEETFHHEPVYLAAWKAGSISGILPAFHIQSRLFGRLFATLPFFTYAHAVSDDRETENQLLLAGVREARKRNVGFWIIRQGEFCGKSGVSVPDGFHVRPEKVNVLLQVPATETQLWEGFRSKLRSQIRKAEKNGLECREGRQELLVPFYRVFSTNMRDLGTPVYPVRFFSSLLDNWEESRIFTVWKAGVPVGAAMTIGWRGRIEVPWASTIRSYNPLAPNMLLYHSMLKHAVREKYRTFDFGRSTPGEGTHTFKLQWGGEESRLPWLYWTSRGEPPVLNRRNRKFTALSNLWKRIPLPVAEFLGPLIIRDIP